MAFTKSTCREYFERILAIVLLFAAAMKAYSLLVTPLQVAASLPSGRLILITTIEIESVLGIWLLIGGFSRARFYCAFGCFAFFAVVAFDEAIHAAPTCGCFGNWKVPPAITSTMDCIACATIWLTRPRSAGSDNRRPSYMKLAIGFTVLLLATSTLLANVSASRAGMDPETVVNPASWLNRPFALLNKIAGGSKLKQGRWLVVFYHYGCDDCRRAIPTYTALAATMSGDPDQPQISFVAIPPYASTGQDPVLPSLDYLHLSLRDDGSWSAATPVVVALQDGEVLAVNEGDKAFIPPDVPEWRSPNRPG
jgi:hypothetical protein